MKTQSNKDKLKIKLQKQDQHYKDKKDLKTAFLFGKKKKKKKNGKEKLIPHFKRKKKTIQDILNDINT